MNWSLNWDLLGRSNRRLRFVMFALASASGCEDARAPIDLDAIVVARDGCVTVVHEALEIGGPLHRFVSDGPGSAGGWALTTVVNDDNLQELAIMRIPASAGEAATPVVELGTFIPGPQGVELRAGAEPGEVWVLSQAGSVISLRRLLPELGLAASNSMLGNFPATEHSGCPTAHARSLLLSEGRPYLLAIPDCSEDPTLSLGLLALDRETLEYGTSWALNFDPCSEQDPSTCALLFAYWLPVIGAGGSPLLPDASRIPIGFTQQRVFTSPASPEMAPESEQMLTTSDVVLLDMRITADGPSARLVTLRSQWIHDVPVSLGPVSVTQDPYSIQLHVRNELLADDALLMRFDTIDDLYMRLRDLLPFDGQGQLVQLADQGVMLDIEDGVLRGIPLIDIDTWVGSSDGWHPHELHSLPDLLDFEVAGVGQLLLRREQAPPQVVHVACLQ